MDQKTLQQWAGQYGTPLYVYDGDKMEEQYEKLKGCLPEKFEVFYSVKSNPLLGVCQLFRKLGSRIEVASSGELHTVLAAGYEPHNIIFTSPGKTREDLALAIDRQIYSINIESVEEAETINEMAAARAKRVNLAVRVNPNFAISGAGLRMTGAPTQFGIDQDDADEAIRRIQSLPCVNLIGVHVFSGSQMLDANNIIGAMREIIRLAVELSDKHKFDLEFLDLGGGFGIPYFKGEEYLDMNRLKDGLAEIWSESGDRLRHTRIGVESGRFLVAESGVFLSKVLYVKGCKGSKYVVCDGGSNQHASSAFLGRYVRNNFPMYLLGKEDAPRQEVNVSGPLCTPTDMIGQRVALAEAEPGDILAVGQSGAYGLTHSPTLFLSHPMPAEILHYRHRVTILRERGEAEDFLYRQHPWMEPEELSRSHA